MKDIIAVSITLYSHNLNEPYKSFDSSFKISDFRKDTHWAIARAKKVVYKNPKGEEVVIK